MKAIRQIPGLSGNPITIIDIGARGGVHHRWTKVARCYPIKVIGFDADINECGRLNAGRKPYEVFLPHAIHSAGGKKDFYVTEFPGSYSFHEPDLPYLQRFSKGKDYNVRRMIELNVVPLDQVLRENRIKDVDHMKLDAEGGEREILNGARETLSAVFSIETEVWFNTVNKGAVGLSELDGCLRKQGFVLFDIARAVFYKRKGGADLGGPKGQLFNGNALYMRDLLNADNATFCTRDKLVKCIVISMAYGYYDYALEMASHFENRFEAGQADAVKRVIVNSGKRLGNFKGRYRLSRFLGRISRFLSVEEQDYLGNW